MSGLAKDDVVARTTIDHVVLLRAKIAFGVDEIAVGIVECGGRVGWRDVRILSKDASAPFAEVQREDHVRVVRVATLPQILEGDGKNTRVRVARHDRMLGRIGVRKEAVLRIDRRVEHRAVVLARHPRFLARFRIDVPKLERGTAKW